MSSPWDKARRPAPAAVAPEADTGGDEQRLYGINAIRALFARRPQALRKLYLSEARVPELREILKWCATHRVGYRVVEEDDLRRLAASSHHEGVVADVLRAPMPRLDAWLPALPPGPCCVLWLDGVGNPHNLGAILRSAANFGVAGVIVPAHASLQVSGAAARVAEGGAEMVPLVRADGGSDPFAALRAAGFTPVATLVHGGDDVFADPLPARVVYVMGAEQAGMDRGLAASCDRRISIPGTGAVESLNVATATGVLLAEWFRQHRASR